MASYAEINAENVVVGIFVGRDPNDLAEGVTDWETYYSRPGYRAKIYGDSVAPGRQAGIGYIFDDELDAFIPPKPSEDAVLDEATFTWIVPAEEE
jgi:hypothetical protein